MPRTDAPLLIFLALRLGVLLLLGPMHLDINISHYSNDAGVLGVLLTRQRSGLNTIHTLSFALHLRPVQSK